MAGRYVAVEVGFWQRREVRRLSMQEKMVLLFLATSPVQNVVGCSVVVPGYVADFIAISCDEIKEILQRLTDCSPSFIAYDPEISLVYIKGHFSANPIGNPSVVTSALSRVSELPDSPVWASVADELTTAGKAFLDPLIEELRCKAGLRPASPTPCPAPCPTPCPAPCQAPCPTSVPVPLPVPNTVEDIHDTPTQLTIPEGFPCLGQLVGVVSEMSSFSLFEGEDGGAEAQAAESSLCALVGVCQLAGVEWRVEVEKKLRNAASRMGKATKPVLVVAAVVDEMRREIGRDSDEREYRERGQSRRGRGRSSSDRSAWRDSLDSGRDRGSDLSTWLDSLDEGMEGGAVVK
jgi:hypothetical protein